MLRKSLWIVGLVPLLLAACTSATSVLPQTSSAVPFPIAASPTGEAPSVPTPAPVMVFPDIPYEQIDGVDPNLLSLDIYSPLTGGPNTPRPAGVFPVVVYFHGGSWRTGDKRDATVTGVKSPYFTSHGVIFVSVNYRLAPLVKHPAQVEDVAAALAWVHAYIDYYGGDTRQIYVMGHSAGGQLAALVATDERYLAAHSLKLDRIHGVILLDGVGLDIPAMITPSTLSLFETAFGSDPTVWREASPLYHISSGKGIPPFLMFYAVENGKGLATSQEMAQALTVAGVENELVAAEGRNHATIVDDIGTPGDPVSARILEFLTAMKP